jgi:hypothetical protein
VSDPATTATPVDTELGTEPVISEDEFDFIAVMKVSEVH